MALSHAQQDALRRNVELAIARYTLEVQSTMIAAAGTATIAELETMGMQTAVSAKFLAGTLVRMMHAAFAESERIEAAAAIARRNAARKARFGNLRTD